MVEIICKTGPVPLSWFATDDNSHPIQETNRWRFALRSHAWRPPTDVYETEEALIVRVEIAGVREEDFTIVLEGRYLLIRGVRPDSTERRAYHQLEIPFGEFSTEVEIPCPIVAEKIDAFYKDGFLHIDIPKAKPHHVQIDG